MEGILVTMVALFIGGIILSIMAKGIELGKTALTRTINAPPGEAQPEHHTQTKKTPNSRTDSSQTINYSTVDRYPLSDLPLKWVRNRAGKDAVTFASRSGIYWICVCGTNNLNSINNPEQKCEHCGRIKKNTLDSFTEAQYTMRP